MPTTNVESPSCRANTGINGTTAPVPAKEIKHIDDFYAIAAK